MKSITAALLIAPVLAFAQQNAKDQAQEQDPTLRTRQAIEQAMSQARTMQANQLANGPKSGLDVAELRKMKTSDPAELAARYQATGVGERPPSPDLMVFISTSMPAKALTLLGEQAKATGAVLVLRGMKGALGTKGVMQKTMEAIKPAAVTGATIQIDPEAFIRYNVTAAPTFVMASKEEGCENSETCDSKSYALAGDVTLEYALENWSSRGGAVGKQADVYLQRIEGAKQ